MQVEGCVLSVPKDTGLANVATMVNGKEPAAACMFGIAHRQA